MQQKHEQSVTEVQRKKLEESGQDSFRAWSWKVERISVPKEEQEGFFPLRIHQNY